MATLENILKNYDKQQKARKPTTSGSVLDDILAEYDAASGFKPEAVAAPEEDGLLDRTALDAVPRAAAAGIGDIGADLMFRDIDADAAEKVRLAKEQQTIADSSLPEPLAKLMYTDVISPQVNKVAAALGDTETYKSVFKSLSDYVTSSRKQVDEEVNKGLADNPIRGYAERAVVDVAGSAPSTLASIPGGAFAAIPAVIQKNDSYRAAREAGADPDDAEEYANLMAAAEGGISMIPTGRLFKIAGKPFFKKAEEILAKKVAGTGFRTLTTMLGEGAEEGLTTGVQDVINRVEADDDTAMGRFAKKNVSEDIAADMTRAAAAGVVGGGLAAPHHSVQAEFDRGIEVGRTFQHAADEFGKQSGEARKKADLAVLDKNAQIDEQITGLEKEVAFDDKEAADAQRKADEEEAAFRNNELRTREADLKDTAMGNAMLKGFEWTPELVAQERQAKQAQEDKAQEAVAADRAIQDETTRRLQEDMARLDAEDKAKAEAAKAKPAPAPKKPAPKEALVLEQDEEGTGDVDVNEARKLLEDAKASTPLAERKSTAETPSVDMDDYKKKLNTFVGGLVKKNTQQATDVRSLIHQRKLVVAPNPESIGRKDDGAAMYDPDTGKMYVYLDRTDPADTVSSIVSAVHESTHAGQFNQREGRGRVLESMFSKNPVSKIKQSIYAAEGKNALADSAIANAREAREAYAKLYPSLPQDKLDELEGLELMAYFAGEAQKPGTKGRLRGVSDQLVAGTKSLLRAAGVDMDVSLNDVEQSTRKIVGELVKTNLKPLSDNEAEPNLNKPLAMIGGKEGAGFKKAKAEGRTYEGKVDRLERYEIPDYKAELNVDDNRYVSQLLEGRNIALHRILKHDLLFEDYPVLRQMEVRTEPKYEGTSVNGSYSGGMIKLNPRLAEMALEFPADMQSMEKLRNLLLHEAQHAVQSLEDHVGGAAMDEFIPLEIQAKKNIAAKDLDKADKAFDLDKAVAALSPSSKDIWERRLKGWSDGGGDSADKRIFVQAGFHNNISDTDIRAKAEAYKQAFIRDIDARGVFDTAKNKAFETYLRDYGETEARNTEHRSRMAPEELSKTAPEETMKNARENIDVDRTINSRPFAKARSFAESVDDSFESRRKKQESDKRRDADVAFHENRMREAEELIQRYEEKYSNYTPEREADDIIKMMGRDVTRFERNKIISDVKKMRSAIKESNNVPLAMADGSRARKAAPEAKLSNREHLHRVIAHRNRTQTADLKQAEHLDTQYYNALKADGVQANERVQEDMRKALSSIDLATPEGKASWAAFKKKYPNTSKVIASMRNKLHENTLELLSERLNNPNITSEDTKEIAQMLKELASGYLPRAFTALQPRIGKQWAERRLKDYQNTQPTTRWKEALRSMDKLRRKLSAGTKANVEEVQKGIRLFEKYFTIPSNDILEELPIKDLARRYEDHVGKASDLKFGNTEDGQLQKRQAMIDALAEAREALTEDQLNTMAEQAVREMLGLAPPTHATVKFFKKAMDTRGFKATEIPEDLAKLMGEIKDPAGLVLSALSKQSAIKANIQMLNDLAKNQVGRLVVPRTEINKPGMRKKFPEQLSGDKYGPLKGMHTTTAVKDNLDNIYEAYYTWAEAWDKISTHPSILLSKAFTAATKNTAAPITRLEKISGVVIDPVNWLNNLIGSGATLIGNGNFNIDSYKKGGQTAVNYVASAWYNNTTDMLQDAVRYLNIEAVETAEMQRVLGDKLQNYIGGQESTVGIFNTLQKGFKQVRRAGRTGMAGYAMMDAWAKIANFHARLGDLQAYYKIADPSKSLEDIKREAGDDTSFTNFSAERVPRILRTTEAGGVTEFIPYFSETFRTVYANYAQGIKDLQRAKVTSDPKAARIMRNAGVRRLVGNFLMTGYAPTRLILQNNKLAAASVFGLLALTAGDDDAEKRRRMLGEFNRYADLVPVGMDEAGNPIYVPVSARLDPVGPATDFLRLLVNSASAGEAGEAALAELADLIISPKWMEKTYKSLTENSVPESRMARMAPEMVDAAANTLSVAGLERSDVNKLFYVLDSGLPGIVKAQDPEYLPKPTAKSVGGEENRKMVEAMARAGVDFETLNIERSMRGYRAEANKAYDEAKDKLNDALASPKSLTDSNFLDAVTAYAGRHRTQHEEDKLNLESLRAWKVDDETAAKLFVGDGFGLSKAQAKRLVEGDDTIYISKKSLKSALKKKDNEDRLEQIEALVDKHKKELQEMGVEVDE